VRVVGLTPRLFGVTDGKSVLYRSPHDGYVLAFGAWPFHVDVRYGLAAVTYGGGAVEADSDGSARTGLLGCRCVEAPEFTLLCSTAPYVQHIDDDLAGLNASSVHRVAFPNILLTGMTCQNTAVRVMPLRWPRRRLATAQGGGSGFTGYDRFSFQDTVNRYTGDGDVTDNLRLLAARERVLPSGAVEAVIYVQPVCGSENSVTCAAEERDNCFPWCMAVVRRPPRAEHHDVQRARVGGTRRAARRRLRRQTRQRCAVLGLGAKSFAGGLGGAGGSGARALHARLHARLGAGVCAESGAAGC
jgi:hypothetical protein